MIKQQLYDAGLANEQWDREHREEMQALFRKITNGEMKTSDLTEEQKAMLTAWCRREQKRVREKIRQTDEKIEQMEIILDKVRKIKRKYG